MAEPNVNIIPNEARFSWVRLRTLVMLRWLTIAGQFVALVIAVNWLGLDIRVDLSATVIGVAVAFNIVATVVFPENRRLSERAALMTLMFDLVQMAALIGLTGGLTNPFSVLLLTPVVMAATALNLRATLLLGLVAIVMLTLLMAFAPPMRLAGGAELAAPLVLSHGTWVALITSVVFLAIYSRRVMVEVFSMSQALAATQAALGREQKLTALGGVVAAAAHELGTPLATIKLVSSELADELEDQPELLEDVRLIREQADRCRDILHEMGRTGKDDTLMQIAPISALVQEAAEPHIERGKQIISRINGRINDGPGADHMLVARQSEIIHGLRNLIQNAVDFADSKVWIDISWGKSNLRVHIGDDGPGYPVHLIGRIGDPFVRKRGQPDPERPGYEGMGLGLFIAKTLLERTGAQLTFANGSEWDTSKDEPPETARPTGAIVEVVWPRETLEITLAQARAPLGKNQPFGY
ncbi:MAG: ActS/PrrB/RegB family redox-sensitive histidine kinase [Rhodobacteraceae bacterium]|nr:ActS/PrrB/RegB family redox-sensitive histidine kinase [Paracoccaceae bacterium]